MTQNKKLEVPVEPDIGDVVRTTIVKRIWLGADKPLGIEVSGNGHVEEAIADLTIAQADLTDKVIIAILEDDEVLPEEQQAENLPKPIDPKPEPEALTDDGD